jgi:ATP-dependent DNA helicase RecG
VRLAVGAEEHGNLTEATPPFGPRPRCAAPHKGRKQRDMARSDTPSIARRTFGSENHFDAQPVPQATLDDLDLELVRRHIRNAREHVSRFDAPDDPLEFLRNRNCLVDDTPTLAGLLVFGNHPQALLSYAGIALTHFYGTGVTTQVRHSDTIEGTLGTLITAAEEYLWEHTQHGFDASLGPQRRRVDQYPRTVLRELTVNAVCHRDYSRTSRIRMQVFVDRIEWASPGSLPEPVTVDNIIYEQATRNPTIVRLLYEAGFIEERGLGLDTVFSSLQEQGLPKPVLLDTGGSFIITVQGRQNIIAQGDTSGLNEYQIKMLSLLTSQGGFTIADCERIFPNRSRRMLNRDIKGLIDANYVTRVGNTNNMRYIPLQEST